MRISDWSSTCALPICARPVRALAEHLAERAPAALAVEQAEQVAGDVLEEHSPRQLAFHVRPPRAQQLVARAQLPAAPGRVPPVQPPGSVVRDAAETGRARARERVCQQW